MANNSLPHFSLTAQELQALTYLIEVSFKSLKNSPQSRHVWYLAETLAELIRQAGALAITSRTTVLERTQVSVSIELLKPFLHQLELADQQWYARHSST